MADIYEVRGQAKQSLIDDTTINLNQTWSSDKISKMTPEDVQPKAPSGAPHAGIDGGWVKLEGTAVTSIVLVKEELFPTVTNDVLTFSQEDWDRKERFTVIFNGACIVFFKSSNADVLFAVGEGGLNYKFEIDRVNRQVHISRVPVLFSNENILDNWDFRNPVNQRALSSYTGNNQYTIDRWILGSQGAHTLLEVHSGFVRFSLTGTAGNRAWWQRIENAQSLNGKTLTFSLLYRLPINNVVSICMNIESPTSATTYPVLIPASDEFRLLAYTFIVPANRTGTGNSIGVALRSGSSVGDSIDIQAAKLELGTESTLLNDPPVDFGKELITCQRFYEKSYIQAHVPGTVTASGMVHAVAIDNRYLPEHRFRVIKRANPAISIFARNGTPNHVTVESGTGHHPNPVLHTNPSEGTLNLDLGANNITRGTTYRYHFTASADL